MGRMRIPGRTTSRLMSGLAGREVVLIEGLEVSPGAQFKITFISWSDKRRQGIWFGTEGLLEFPDTGLTSPQMTLWTDTAPAEFQIDVLETDGLLRFYNIWDEGEGRGSESLVDYSGMVVDHDGGVATYRCQDFGREPHFSSLAFTMESLR